MMTGKRNLRSRRILRGLLLVIGMFLITSGCVTGSYLEAESQTLKGAPAGTRHTQEKPAAALQNRLPAHVESSHVEAESNPAAVSVKQTSLVAVKVPEPRKVVYLTFDDGPSPVTAKVLDILQREGVKATFFVLGNGAESHPELINAIWEQGHAIGNHTYNHNYHDLYSRFTVFWSQIKQTEEIVRRITGTRPQLIRAPGGTADHFDDTYFSLLKQAGYVVTDWNVDSGDSKRKGVPAAEIIKEAVPDTSTARVVLLMHDGGGHEESARALPAIIARYKAAGYAFGVLDNQVEPVQFKVTSGSAGAGRAKPSAAWIASHITVNTALFQPAKPLMLEVGRMETQLKPGEYFIKQNQYMVPLRTVIERLGGQVSWEADIRSAKVTLNGHSFMADVENRELAFSGTAGGIDIRSGKVEMIGGNIWIPLRDLLEIAEHPPLSVSVTADERRVRAY